MSGYDITEPRLRCVLPFEAEPAEVCLLRKAVAEQLGRWGISAATDEAQLAVSELAANVIHHVGEGAAATLILERMRHGLRVEVHDKSPVVPSPVTAGCDEECGRGLWLLTALAVDWGTVLTATGKAVWCEISVDAERHRHRVERAAVALERYRYAPGGAGPGSRPRAVGHEEAATELIADLLHWVAAQGRDPDDILDRAQMHYEADVSDAA